MTGIPVYSDSGLAARDIFSFGFEEIFFYVEDEEQENLYENIFNRCFPKINKFKVFPLKGKSNVLDHAVSFQPQLGAVARIYVLDKDFDDLLETKVIASNIFYLDYYCLENLFIDEYSLVQLAIEERPRRNARELKEAIQFFPTMHGWIPVLDKLHRAFYLAQKFELPLKNCDLPPEFFGEKGNPGNIDQLKIDNYISNVKEALIDKNLIDSDADYEELSRKSFGSGRKFVKHINGKFLMKLWYHRMRACDAASNMRIESMTIRLSKMSDLKRLKSFRRKVNAYIDSVSISVTP